MGMWCVNWPGLGHMPPSTGVLLFPVGKKQRLKMMNKRVRDSSSEAKWRHPCPSRCGGDWVVTIQLMCPHSSGYSRHFLCQLETTRKHSGLSQQHIIIAYALGLAGLSRAVLLVLPGATHRVGASGGSARLEGVGGLHSQLWGLCATCCLVSATHSGSWVSGYRWKLYGLRRPGLRSLHKITCHVLLAKASCKAHPDPGGGEALSGPW